MYFILIISMIVSMMAQMYVSSSYNRFANVRAKGTMSGAQVAQHILEANGVHDVRIVRSPNSGTLTDNYNPANKTVTLSHKIYDDNSIASIAVAAHEVGHAIQYAKGYAGIKFRSLLLQPAIIASQFSQIMILIGIGALANSGSSLFFNIGILMMGIVTLFQVATLPVEFDASARALKNIQTLGLVDSNEYSGAKTMLTAAALTYVASVLTSLMNIAYYIFLGESRRRN
jgi:uncharacterized protein